MALVMHHRPPSHELGDRFVDVARVHDGDRFVVYSARESGTNRRVFVKIVARDDQRWLVDALDDQAAILGALSAHPNIITLYQRMVVPDGRPALVLEYSPVLLSGAPEAHVRQDPRSVTSVGIKLAGALDTVHRMGVLHCDVQPNNVLRNAWDEPVLAGFNNAVRIDRGVPSHAVLSRPGPHTAPELLLGDEASARTDVYGLAATLYELLAGRSAFREYAGESLSATAVRVLDGTVKPLVAPGIPLALSDLITWALAPLPADRPPSMAWLAEELRRIETDEGWSRTPFVA